MQNGISVWHVSAGDPPTSGEKGDTSQSTQGQGSASASCGHTHMEATSHQQLCHLPSARGALVTTSGAWQGGSSSSDLHAMASWAQLHLGRACWGRWLAEEPCETMHPPTTDHFFKTGPSLLLLPGSFLHFTCFSVGSRGLKLHQKLQWLALFWHSLSNAAVTKGCVPPCLLHSVSSVPFHFLQN